MSEREKERNMDTGAGSSLRTQQAGETQREFLIRTGKITPFSRISGLERGYHDAGEEELATMLEEKEMKSHQFLRAPGFESPMSGATSTTSVTSGSSDIETDDVQQKRKR